MTTVFRIEAQKKGTSSREGKLKYNKKNSTHNENLVDGLSCRWISLDEIAGLE